MTKEQIDPPDIEKVYRLAFDHSDELIAILKPNYDFKISLINEKVFKSILNYSLKDLYQTSFLKIVDPDQVQTVVKVLKRGENKLNKEKEIKLIGKDRTEKWFEIKSREFKDQSNNKYLFVKLKPIQVKKNLEFKLKESEKSLKNITDKIPEIRFWKLFSPEKFEDALKNSYEMLEMVIENIPQYIFWKDRNLNYLGCNKKYAKFLGLEFADNLIGKKDKDLIENSKKVKSLEDNEKQVLTTGKGQFNVVEKWEINGQTHLFNTNRIPLLEKDNGKILGILISYDDITERKRAEQKLKESEQKFRNITEQSVMGILIMQDFQIKYANDKFLNIIDYGYEEVLNWKPKEFFKLIHPDDLERVQKIIHNKYEGKIKVITDLQFRFVSKTGEVAWVEVRSKTIPYKGDDADLAYLVDITERKRAQQKLKHSERKYKSLLKTSSVGVIEININKQTISYVNAHLLNILGYSREELSIDLLQNLIHSDDSSKIYGDLEEKEIEFRIFNKNGNLRWLSGKRVRQYDEDDKLINLRFWLDDITERKMYERLITELNIDFLNFTVDIQNNIQMLLNTSINLLNGEIALYIQKQEEENQYRIITSDSKTYTYYDIEEFQQNIFAAELFKENHDFPQTILDINQTKYNKTDPIIRDYKIKGAYGKLIKSENTFSEAVCVLFDDNPTISHEHQLILFLISDAIEIEHRRWQVKEFLEDQNKMLNEMNQLKSELLTRTSHELKTPLISIKGFAELLLKLHRKKMDSDMISIIEGIMDGSKRMEKIINTLIKTSRLNQGHLELNKIEEDLGFLIKFCLDEIKGLINLRNHSIELNLEEDLKTKIDKERIYEVLTNLMVNAVKFTPPGGQITISSKKDDDRIITSIQDNGVGLTNEEKTQLFKQFGKIERYGKGWDLGIEGSGLGLYISKKIIELHGGKIWAKSEGRNQGSTFYFTLPLED
ncbi:MAG: Signal transduction histidine kinase [Promethearchaeota archaeon]|nr:MAG: Signal transduction histidine kinase [Candidatus Lokiarchaeota archaeon]